MHPVQVIRQVAGSLLWLAVVVLAVVTAVVLDRLAAPVAASPRLDRPAPTFLVLPFNGAPVAPDQVRGRPVVVNFWAPWCGDCQEEAPLLERLWPEYRARGAVFVGIPVHPPTNHDPEHNARAYVRRLRLTYPNGPTFSNAAAAEFSLSGVPETYFIDRQGRIVRRYVGRLTEADLRAFLEELLR